MNKIDQLVDDVIREDKKAKSAGSEFVFEVALSVEDYSDGDDRERDAFDAASEDIDGATKLAKEDIADAFDGKAPKEIVISNVEFAEFDSGNITHAAAYFAVTVTGPKDLLDKLAKHMES